MGKGEGIAVVRFGKAFVKDKLNTKRRENLMNELADHVCTEAGDDDKFRDVMAEDVPDCPFKDSVFSYGQDALRSRRSKGIESRGDSCSEDDALQGLPWNCRFGVLL